MKQLIAAAAAISVLGVATAGTAQIAGPERALTAPAGVISPRAVHARPIPLDVLFRTAQSDSAVWAADGRSIYYTSDRSGMSSVWQARADGTGMPRQIGLADRKQSRLALSDDGKTLFFQSDIGGRQINDVYAMPANGGPAVNLTDTPDIDEGMAVPSPDGRFLALARRTKTQSSNNLAILDLVTRQVRTLTDEQVAGVQWWPAAISRDGRLIVANRFDWGQTVGEAWLVEAATGKARRLTAEGVYAEAGGISSDGHSVAVSIEDAKGVLQAGIVDVASGALTKISAGQWEHKAGLFSPDGRCLTVVRNVDGRNEVALYDVVARRSRTLALPAGINSRSYHGPALPRFSPDGRQLLFPHSSGAEPLDYWVHDLSRNRQQKVTDLGGMGTVQAVKTQLVHYSSFDGTVISAFLWMPYNLKRDGLAPAVVRPHGGPTDQTMDSFDRASAALASRGYIVLAPNFRGSTGYGRDFLDANHKDLGGGDLEDVVAGTWFLVSTGFVDAKRIGIMGGSYGGYMTLIALAKKPNVWAAGVDSFGIVNWRTMWDKGTLANHRYQATLIGDPQKDPAAYDRASPLTYLSQVRAPLLVLHGENDPIVPVGEAHQVIEQLRTDGKTIASHIYAEEGHGLSKRENQIDSVKRTIDWFDRWLAPRR